WTTRRSTVAFRSSLLGRRRPGPTTRDGETTENYAHSRHARRGGRLDRPRTPPEQHVVLVLPYRPVALRWHAAGPALGALGPRAAPAPARRRHERAGRPPRLAAVLSAVRRAQPHRAGAAGTRGGRRDPRARQCLVRPHATRA